MEKVDYSNLIKEIEDAKKAPVLETYSITLSVDVMSENFDLAQETVQMLVEYFNRFNDVKITDVEW